MECACISAELRSWGTEQELGDGVDGVHHPDSLVDKTVDGSSGENICEGEQ